MEAGLTIGVFGDIGDTINSTVTLGHLAANSPQIIYNVGDLVLACLCPPRYCLSGIPLCLRVETKSLGLIAAAGLSRGGACTW